MSGAELDKKALEIATKSLSKGFDWQAYLVYCAAMGRISEPVDAVPESSADEGMSDVIALFAKYAACKRSGANQEETVKSLEEVMDKLRRVVVEIYHLCGSNTERSVVQKFKTNLPI